MEAALDLLEKNLSSLTPGRKIFVEKLLHDRQKNPSLWTATGTAAVEALQVENLYRLLKNTVAENSSTELKQFVDSLDSSLIITGVRPNWAILELPFSAIEESRKEIEKKYGQKPAVSNWGPHITVVRGERATIKCGDKPKNWELRTGEKFEVTITSKIQEGKNRYFYQDVECPELEILRKDLGLRPKPTPDFHITIGCIR